MPGNVEGFRIAVFVDQPELVPLRPLVAAFDLGADNPEIIAGDQVAIDAEVVVDVDELVAVQFHVGVVEPHRPDLESEVGGVVARRSRRGDHCESSSREQKGFH